MPKEKWISMFTTSNCIPENANLVLAAENDSECDMLANEFGYLKGILAFHILLIRLDLLLQFWQNTLLDTSTDSPFTLLVQHALEKLISQPRPVDLLFMFANSSQLWPVLQFTCDITRVLKQTRLVSLPVCREQWELAIRAANSDQDFWKEFDEKLLAEFKSRNCPVGCKCIVIQ